ncbi:translation initiation factor IF-1 [Patescibacteria group bacterium]
MKKNQENTPSKDKIVVIGQVIETLPNTTFKIKLDEGEHEILGFLSGKMRKHFIKVILGDKVEIEMTPYDLTKGRITKRL